MEDVVVLLAVEVDGVLRAVAVDAVGRSADGGSVEAAEGLLLGAEDSVEADRVGSVVDVAEAGADSRRLTSFSVGGDPVTYDQYLIVTHVHIGIVV